MNLPLIIFLSVIVTILAYFAWVDRTYVANWLIAFLCAVGRLILVIVTLAFGVAVGALAGLLVMAFVYFFNRGQCVGNDQGCIDGLMNVFFLPTFAVVSIGAFIAALMDFDFAWTRR